MDATALSLTLSRSLLALMSQFCGAVRSSLDSSSALLMMGQQPIGPILGQGEATLTIVVSSRLESGVKPHTPAKGVEVGTAAVVKKDVCHWSCCLQPRRDSGPPCVCIREIGLLASCAI